MTLTHLQHAKMVLAPQPPKIAPALMFRALKEAQREGEEPGARSKSGTRGRLAPPVSDDLRSHLSLDRHFSLNDFSILPTSPNFME